MTEPVHHRRFGENKKCIICLIYIDLIPTTDPFFFFFSFTDGKSFTIRKIEVIDRISEVILNSCKAESAWHVVRDAVL
jgi:hypothetical protein